MGFRLVGQFHGGAGNKGNLSPALADTHWDDEDLAAYFIRSRSDRFLEAGGTIPRVSRPGEQVRIHQRAKLVGYRKWRLLIPEIAKIIDISHTWKRAIETSIGLLGAADPIDTWRLFLQHLKDSLAAYDKHDGKQDWTPAAGLVALVVPPRSGSRSRFTSHVNKTSMTSASTVRPPPVL